VTSVGLGYADPLAGIHWLFDATCGCARQFMLSYLDFACFTLVDERFSTGATGS